MQTFVFICACVFERACTWASLHSGYAPFPVDGHMFMSACFHHHELIFAARWIKLPPLHLQGSLRLLSSNSDSVISWPFAWKALFKAQLVQIKTNPAASSCPAGAIDNFSPFPCTRVSRWQAASLCIRISRGGSAGRDTSLIPSALGSDSRAAASVFVCVRQVYSCRPPRKVLDAAGPADRMSWPIFLCASHLCTRAKSSLCLKGKLMKVGK